jgi:integrase
MNGKTKKVRGVYEKVPGSGIWWICYFDADGRKRREKVGRKSDAIDLRTKRKNEALQGLKLPEKLRARKVGFAELAEDTLEYSREHKQSYVDDVVRMGKLKEWLGQRPAESVTPQEIERWLSGKDLKPATLNRYRALLSLTYRLGMQNGKVQANPARLVRQRKENNARLRFLSSEEEQSLRSVIQEKFPHHMPELDIALHTGMRLSEQYGLTWECVDLERKTATIRRSKNGEARYVHLNDDAIAAFRAVRTQGSGQPYVFLNRYGERLVSPREWFRAAVGDAKLANFTWHCLRHTFASRLVMKQTGLRTVQELMGHRTIHMTVRYAHLDPEHQLAAVQKLCNRSRPGEPSDTRSDTRTEREHSFPLRESAQLAQVQ